MSILTGDDMAGSDAVQLLLSSIAILLDEALQIPDKPINVTVAKLEKFPQFRMLTYA